MANWEVLDPRSQEIWQNLSKFIWYTKNYVLRILESEQLDDHLRMLWIDKERILYEFLSLIYEVDWISSKTKDDEVSQALINLSLEEINELNKKINRILTRQVMLTDYCKKKWINLEIDMLKPLCPKISKKTNLQAWEKRKDNEVTQNKERELVDDIDKLKALQDSETYNYIYERLEEINDTIKDLKDLVITKYNPDFNSKKFICFLNENINIFSKIRNHKNNDKKPESEMFNMDPKYYYNLLDIDFHGILDGFPIMIDAQLWCATIEWSPRKVEKYLRDRAIIDILWLQIELFNIFEEVHNYIKGEYNFDTKFTVISELKRFRDIVSEYEYKIKNNTVLVYKWITEIYWLNPDNQAIIDYFNNKFNLINSYYKYYNSERRISIIENYRSKEQKQ